MHERTDDMSAVRLERDDSLLLVIDVQQGLAPRIAGQEDLIRRVEGLLRAAAWFAIPALVTEHCADRIGPTVEQLRGRFDDEQIVAKSAFAATDEARFREKLRGRGRRHIVVAGMEAHVCVLQTVLGLLRLDFRVFVIADAVGSRPPRQDDRLWALQRMQQSGAMLVSTESALFEWTQRAGDPRFRDVLALVKTLSQPISQPIIQPVIDQRA
jgi:nicotinamidase-related amidase